MKIQFYNSLTNRLEEFKPVDPGIVRMYSCGPTVYDFAHIGNFRTFLFGDLLRRFLELAGYDVRHVTNITDVGHMTDDDMADGGGEDKMEVAIQKMKADKKSGKVPDGAIDDPGDPYQIAEYFTNAFLDDGRTLGYKIADEYPARVPKATDNVAGMIELTKKLIDRKHAYIAEDGVVYFDVESFPAYGSLSGNTLQELKSGAGGRVSDQDQSMKRHPADFMLWKPDSHHIMKWDSPWGVGYPGWHIECSVMATKYLDAEVIDIHTGGEDLIFPHHECEIAQSCGASGESHFANYWIHARFLMVDGKKMSKSAGTFYTVRDVLAGRFLDESGQPWGRQIDPAVLRLELIKSHYRSNLNFTAKSISDSAGAVRRIREFKKSLEEKSGGIAAEVDLTHPVVEQFAAALADDLNISGAMGVVLPWASSKPADAAEALGALDLVDSVLAVLSTGDKSSSADSGSGNDQMQQAQEWCKQLDEARANKQYDTADEIRKKIIEAGFEVRTTSEGTSIQKQLV